MLNEVFRELHMGNNTLFSLETKQAIESRFWKLFFFKDFVNNMAIFIYTIKQADAKAL